MTINDDTVSTQIQDWLVINDGLWAQLLPASRVGETEPSDAGELAAAA